MVIDIFMTITTFLVKLIFVDDIYHHMMSLKNLDSVTLKINVCRNEILHDLITVKIWKFFIMIITLEHSGKLFRHILNFAHRQTSGQSEWKYLFHLVCVWWVSAYSFTPHVRTSSGTFTAKGSDSRPLLNRKLGFSDWFCHQLGIWKTAWSFEFRPIEFKRTIIW